MTEPIRLTVAKALCRFVRGDISPLYGEEKAEEVCEWIQNEFKRDSTKRDEALSRFLESVEKKLEERYGPDWRNADQGPDSDLGIIALLYGFLANRENLPAEAQGLRKKIKTGYITDPQAE